MQRISTGLELYAYLKAVEELIARIESKRDLPSCTYKVTDEDVNDLYNCARGYESFLKDELERR